MLTGFGLCGFRVWAFGYQVVLVSGFRFQSRVKGFGNKGFRPEKSPAACAQRRHAVRFWILAGDVQISCIFSPKRFKP